MKKLIVALAVAPFLCCAAALGQTSASASGTGVANAGVDNSGYNQSSASSSSTATGGKSSSNSSSTGGTSSATANPNQTVNVNTGANNLGQGRGFINASAGPTSIPGVFPGLALGPGLWGVADLPFLSSLTVNRIKVIGDGCKDRSTEFSWLDIKDDLPGKNNQPIRLISYDIYRRYPHFNPNDDGLAMVTIRGKPDKNDDITCIGRALYMLKRKAHITRAMVITRDYPISITKGSSWGLGGSFARIMDPGSGNDAATVALGYARGTTKSYINLEPEIRVYGLKESDKFDVPEEGEEVVQPQPPPPPPPQSQKLEITVKTEPAPAPVSVPTSPIPQLAQDNCKADFAVYFNWYNAILLDEILDNRNHNAVVMSDNLKSFHRLNDQILADPPDCKFEFVGSASKEGGEKLNSQLGQDRASNAYHWFISHHRSAASHVCLNVSSGKVLADQDHIDWQDRKVIVRSIGPASDLSRDLCGKP